MQVNVTSESQCRKVLDIEMPMETVNAKFDELLKAFRKQAKIPGFRPGKAPLSLVEKHYAKQIQKEAQESLVPQAYQDAVKQEKLDVVSVVNVGDAEVKKGEALLLKVSVDVKPDFELPEYKGIKVSDETKPVDDEAVDGALAELMERHAQYKDVEDRAVQKHDVLQIAYKGTLDGTPLEEIAPAAKGIGENDNSWVAADENEFLPGLGTGLIGCSKGDSKSLDIQFPEDFQVKELAGKTAVYEVTINDVREKVIPELDEELLKYLNAESEADLREKISKELEQYATVQEDNRRKSEIIKDLMGRVEFELPDSDVQEETRNAVYDIVRKNTQRGVQETAITENKTEIFEAASKNAAEKLKIRYVLHRIADKEEIDVTAGELNAQLQQMAHSYRIPMEKMREEVMKENRLESIREDIRNQKALDYLLSVATVDA